MRTAPQITTSPTRISAGQATSARRYVKEAWERKSLVAVLTSRELKATYEMNLVGFAWWMLEPLSLTLVYVVLVSVILGAAEPAFPLYVLTALLPFKWMTSSLTGSMNVVKANTNLIQNLYFPRALLPVAEVVTSLAHFMVGLSIVPIFMLVYGIAPTWNLLYLPLIIAVQFLVALGLSYPLAVWGISFRNLSSLIGNLYRLWMYLSPALWALETRVDDPTLRNLILLNPLAGLFEAYHGAIGVLPVPGTDMTKAADPGWPLASAAGVGMMALLLGGWYFMRRETQFGKQL